VTATKKTVKDHDYRALAEFRYHIRRYLDFSDRAARAVGMEPKQYQLLLAIKGLPGDTEPTVGTLAEQLHLRHHTTVELINRAEGRQLVERSRIGTRVLVFLTNKGRRVLERAVETRLHELRIAGPVLVKALQALMNSRGPSKNKRKQSPNRKIHGKSGTR
jgi:DNA-binding MarR family transcriptional regulator